MSKITVTRTVKMPDIMRISRYERAPELGPRILFFSGGTALNEISRVLKKFTHNSTHLITPFDSGGSSAVLRDAFNMPAIGDLRSRLMALADETISGQPQIFQLFAHRLPATGKHKDLLAQLQAIVDGKSPHITAIKNPMRRVIRHHLEMFLRAMPDKMDLCGASIGNLILAGGYLSTTSRQLDQVVFMFSKLVNVQGYVSAIVDDTLHLAAQLGNGETVIGQHLLTGKEVGRLTSPIVDFYLVDHLKNPKRVQTHVAKKQRKLIRDVELICYPPGSFYSSLAANLLPAGVGQAIADSPCPKVYAPGLGHDPERIGLNTGQSIFRLLDILRRDAGQNCPTNRLLNFVLIDGENGESLAPSVRKQLRKEGVTLIDTPLVMVQSAPFYDPQLLVMALLSLV